MTHGPIVHGGPPQRGLVHTIPIGVAIEGTYAAGWPDLVIDLHPIGWGTVPRECKGLLQQTVLCVVAAHRHRPADIVESRLVIPSLPIERVARAAIDVAFVRSLLDAWQRQMASRAEWDSCHVFAMAGEGGDVALVPVFRPSRARAPRRPSRERSPRRSTPRPVRTGSTALDDDELLLFDALFDRNASLRVLRRDAIADHYNWPWRHSYEDWELYAVVERFAQRGLMRWIEDTGHSSRAIGLSASGVDLWEQERRPDWSKFATYNAWTNPDGSHAFRIEGCLEGTVRELLAAAREARLFTPAEAVAHLGSPEHLPQGAKRFGAGFALILDATYDRVGPDFDLLRARRTWWDTLTNLIPSAGD